jgi:hypothetical protein
MRTLPFIALIAAGLLAACDTSGIHPLGRLRDPLVPCAIDPTGGVSTSTWLRSTDTATEIFLLGRVDPDDEVAATQPACYGHGVVDHDSSTTFEFGSYSLDAQGRGTAVTAVEYVRLHQPDVGVLRRDGTVRHDLPAPLTEALTIARDGDQIVLSLDGESRRLTSIGAVVDALDPSTQDGADDVFRIFNLPLLTSQARLLGFGSGAMTQYVDQTAEFLGMVRSRFTVSVESFLSPTTDIVYYQLEDLTGVVVDGLQKTKANTSGDGSMEGVLAFMMRGTESAIRGHVDYAELEINNGLAADGTYTLTIDGIETPTTISYLLATSADLRGVLPVESP